jgi:hypothetical protein
MATCPTPPVAPVIRTFRPSRAPPTRTARSAVSPATGSVAACSNDTPSGSGDTQFTGTGIRSAQPSHFG